MMIASLHELTKTPTAAPINQPNITLEAVSIFRDTAYCFVGQIKILRFYLKTTIDLNFIAQILILKTIYNF